MRRRRRRGGRPGPPAGLGPVGTGAWLRLEREARGLGAEVVGDTLKCGARLILALEEGAVEELPPAPYGRGLLTAYASVLGTDPEEVAAAYGPAFRAEGEKGRAAWPRPRRAAWRWRDWSVPIASGVAVLGYLVARAALAPTAPEIPEPPLAQDAVVGSIEQLAAPGEAGSAADAPTTITAPHAEEPVATVGVSDGAVLRILLRSEGSSWVESIADGGELRHQDLGPGQQLEIRARERVGLSLGDAGVVRVRVNERELGFVGFRGETKVGMTFTLPAPPAGKVVAAPAEQTGD